MGGVAINHTGINLLQIWFLFIILLKIALCVNGEYTKQQKARTIYILSIILDQNLNYLISLFIPPR
jgi:hypothetical protein